MRFPVYYAIAAVLAAASCASAQGQGLSRVDVQLGVLYMQYRSGDFPKTMFMPGATVWISDHSGISMSGILGSGYHFLSGIGPPDEAFAAYGDDRGIEVMYRHRRFVSDFEIDFGVGAMWNTLDGVFGRLRDDGRPGVRRERLKIYRRLRMDILVGRRLADRLSVKGGLACSIITGFWGGNGDAPVLQMFKIMAVVALGSR